LHFYDNTRKELTRYRDMEWRIPSYVLAFFSAVIVVALNAKFAKSVSGLAKDTLFIAIILMMLISVGLLAFFHWKLTTHRRRRQWLEIIFKFHTPNEFVTLTQQQAGSLPDYLKKYSDRVLSNDIEAERIGFFSDFWQYTLPFSLAIILVGSFVAWLVLRLPLFGDAP